MKTRLALTMLVTVLIAGVIPQLASAQSTETTQAAAAATSCSSPMTIDDFSSGAYSKTTSQANTAVDATKSGSMLGGLRFTRFVVGTNPYENGGCWSGASYNRILLYGL